MVFYWVIGLVVILYVLSESILFQLRNEIVQSNYIMRAEITSSVCDSLIEEAFMEVRRVMNDHNGIHNGDAYNVLRMGAAQRGAEIRVDTPVTVGLAKKYHGITDLGVVVTYENPSPFKEDFYKRPRKIDQKAKESFGTLKITARATLDGYSKVITACKDIKVVRILPPFPEFSFFVRDGGNKKANYNRWVSYHGAEQLNLRILSGRNASKTGIIFFGGGMADAQMDYIKGFKPWPAMSTFQEGRAPIIINTTNMGILSKDGGTLLDNLQSRNFSLSTGGKVNFDITRMLPTFDMWGIASPGTDVMKQSLGALADTSLKSKIPMPPQPGLEVMVPKPQPKQGGQQGSQNPSGQDDDDDQSGTQGGSQGGAQPGTQGGAQQGNQNMVELEHRYLLLGSGFELSIDGEDSSLPTEKGMGFLNYFKDYIEYCKDSDHQYLNPLGSGVDLFGSDMRQGKDSTPHITRVYGNVLRCLYYPFSVKNKKEAMVIPWVDFTKVDISSAALQSQKNLIPKKFLTENCDRSFFQKLGATLSLSDEKKKKLSFIPHIGMKKGNNTDSATPIAELEENPTIANQTDNNKISYLYVMSRPQFLPYDTSNGGGNSFFLNTVPFNGEDWPSDKLTKEFPIDLTPEMAQYNFVNAEAFIESLKAMQRLEFDKSDNSWHMYLDGIWYVEAMKSFDEEFSMLRLPPDAPAGGPLFINGKGMIASVHGMDILVNGIIKDKNSDDDQSQLSILTVPNPVFDKISALPDEIRNIIFSTQNGNIFVTDAYIQASICAGIGTLGYKDNPAINASTARGVFPYHGPDSGGNDRQNNFDSFFIRGNLIVNHINLETLEEKSGTSVIGGGAVAYDEKLFPDRTGKGEHDANYIVNMSQCYTYYKIDVLHDDQQKQDQESAAAATN